MEAITLYSAWKPYPGMRCNRQTDTLSLPTDTVYW